MGAGIDGTVDHGAFDKLHTRSDDGDEFHGGV
jgi:hypothetical protein